MFENEIKKIGNFTDVLCENKLTIFKQNLLIVEGCKKLINYEENLIIYEVNNHEIKITGTNLKIEQINNIELVISGKIEGINFEK